MSSAQRLEATTSTQSLPEKPWHAYITIDLLALVLARSVFHPYIAWLVPLCLRSLSYSYSHPHFQYACVYATCISIFALLRMLDKRLAWGAPRKLNWDDEVVVITGGSGGLGKVLAETYGMRGVSVAVLDIREPEEQSEALENVRFYKCDVSSIEDVRRAKLAIEQDVRREYQKHIPNSQVLPPLTPSPPARPLHNPHQQCRHRLRRSSALPETFTNQHDPPDKPPLPLPHPPDLPPLAPRLSFRRHNRHHRLCPRPSRRRPPDRLRRRQSRPDRPARVPTGRTDGSKCSSWSGECENGARDTGTAWNEVIRGREDSELVLGTCGRGCGIGAGDCEDCG